MIDTQNKRRSVEAYLLGLMRPVADGTVGAADRATCAWYYAGLTYSPPVAGGGISLPTGISPDTGISYNHGISIGTGISRFVSLITGGLGMVLRTAKQLKVLKLIADGFTNPEIATECKSSLRSAHDIVGRIFVRLGAKNRAHAVALGFRNGLL